MLLYVKLSNFRGVDSHIHFGDPSKGTASRVQLKGRNGARKTTIREAIAFAFTGRDSQGTTKPTHLISFGQDACEVEVMTRKGAVINRRLTMQGGGHLWIMTSGAQRVLTQAELEAMLCPADVFLSVLVPGYLMGTLPKNRQTAVLSYVLPPVDRRAIVERLTGYPPSMTLDLDYSVQPHILQKRLADQRNKITNRTAELRGEQKVLRERLSMLPSKPVEPPEVKLLEAEEKLRREWIVYEASLSREQIEAELSELREVPLPPVMKPFDIERPLEPRPPLYLPDEQRDRCPSCGQTVGLKHRELVRAHNDKLRLAYEAEHAAWLKNLEAWSAECKAHLAAKEECDRACSEARATNMRIEQRRRQLEATLRAMPGGEGVEAKRPRDEFSKERYAEMNRIAQEYQRQLGAFESWQKSAASSELRLIELEQTIIDAAAEVDLLRAHEAALKQLPDEELEEQKAHLSLSGFDIRVGDGLQLWDRNGCPYEILSRGARMRADFELCLRINALLERKVGMIFLDDFDLADWSELLRETPGAIQIFSAHVGASELYVGLSNYV